MPFNCTVFFLIKVFPLYDRHCMLQNMHIHSPSPTVNQFTHSSTRCYWETCTWTTNTLSHGRCRYRQTLDLHPYRHRTQRAHHTPPPDPHQWPRPSSYSPGTEEQTATNTDKKEARLKKKVHCSWYNSINKHNNFSWF